MNYGIQIPCVEELWCGNVRPSPSNVRRFSGNGFRCEVEIGELPCILVPEIKD